MLVEQMSDRKLEAERNLMSEWIETATPDEHVSGEVESWQNQRKLIDAEIERRHEQGDEIR
jgi:hypothetical protein